MNELPVRITVELPTASVEVSGRVAAPPNARAVAAVAHGAGGTSAHPFFDGFVEALTGAGIATLRFNFPYSEAGRRMPGPAGHAISTWRAVEAWLARELPGMPLWAVGKSYGGRMASMAAAQAQIAPRGLVYLGYPLHPPGEPTKLRVEHLPDIAAPQLFIEGTNDPFVTPHEHLIEAVSRCQDAEILWIENAGHSFEIKGRKRTAAEIGADLGVVVADHIVTAP